MLYFYLYQLYHDIVWLSRMMYALAGKRCNAIARFLIVGDLNLTTLHSRRIVVCARLRSSALVCARLRSLGSAYSLLCAVNRCENNT